MVSFCIQLTRSSTWAYGLIPSSHLNHTLIMFYTRLTLAPVFYSDPGAVLHSMSGRNLLHNSYFMWMWLIKMLQKLTFCLLLQLLRSSVDLFSDVLLICITVQCIAPSVGLLSRQEYRFTGFNSFSDVYILTTTILKTTSCALK